MTEGVKERKHEVVCECGENVDITDLIEDMNKELVDKVRSRAEHWMDADMEEFRSQLSQDEYDEYDKGYENALSFIRDNLKNIISISKSYKMIPSSADLVKIEAKPVKDRTRAEHFHLMKYKYNGDVRDYLLSMGAFKDVDMEDKEVKVKK